MTKNNLIQKMQENYKPKHLTYFSSLSLSFFSLSFSYSEQFLRVKPLTFSLKSENSIL